MFKPARWWSDKNKFKVVFKLQFHASQVTQFGGDGLMVSVVPADTGKPSVKSGKAWVRDGSCSWDNPIYETVKFNEDPKSGKIDERIYHFIVATGSSKPGLIGEASVDFSNYVDATKTSLVSLPIKNLKTEAVLHVSIQRAQEPIDQREIERNENGNHEAVVDAPSNKTVCQAEFDTKRQGSSGSDLTLSSSEGSSGIEAPWELKNDNVHQEWLANSGLEDCTDDSSSSPREAFLEEAPDIVIEKLKADVAALSRQAGLSDLELQSLRKQVVKERKRGQDLWREVVCLKEERDALKGDCEYKTKTDSRVVVEELRQELYHAQEMNANLRIQLAKTQESNSELILAVRDLEEMLEQKNGDVESREVGRAHQSGYKNEYDDDDDDDDEQKELEDLVKEHEDAKETLLLEQQITGLRSEIQVYKRDKDELETQMEALALDYEIMKQANHEMSCKLEQNQLHERLEMQYDSASPETRVDNEVEIRAEEYECSLVVISELQGHVKSLEEELEKQARGFEADLEDVTRSRIEQEQRAVRAEETLKKIRWRNANTAERLQDEFRKLSVQMASSFEANEKLATNAMAEANKLRLQNSRLEEMLRENSEERRSVEACYETRVQQLTSQLASTTSQIERMRLEIEDREIKLENLKKQSEDAQKVLTDEILMLKEEIETHIAKNQILLEDMGSKEAVIRELDKTRISIKELELLVEQGEDEKNELKSRVLLMKSETEDLRKELNEMRSLAKEKELTAENLRKQVLQIRNDLKKKEDFMMKKTNKNLDAVKATMKTNKNRPRESKEVVNLKERINLLESQIKTKETAYETSANAFREKEKDLHNIIEELKQNSAHICENEAEKPVDENSSTQSKTSSVNRQEILSTKRDEELEDETAAGKERNKSMERELKEMQERYLDISLKFAEVEGERQQLVMKLRNLTNATKSL